MSFRYAYVKVEERRRQGKINHLGGHQWRKAIKTNRLLYMMKYQKGKPILYAIPLNSIQVLDLKEFNSFDELIKTIPKCIGSRHYFNKVMDLIQNNSMIEKGKQDDI